ncbi:exodeoxyribonuclease VII large subunit, partial [Aquipuribacter hungaricus]
ERELLRALRARPALTDLRGLFVQRAAVVEDCRLRLRAATRRGLARRSDHLRGTLAHLRALSPAATLDRGYAIVRTVPDAAVVRGADEVSVGGNLVVTLARGHLGVTVAGVTLAGETAPQADPDATTTRSTP